MFKKDFKECYLPRNEKQSAVLKLEGTSYYQERDSVEVYIDRFTELLDLAEYDEVDDACHLASKFRKGLSKSIRSQINMAESQPAYDDFSGWVDAARKVAEN